jgi:hypothetical protein
LRNHEAKTLESVPCSGCSHHLLAPLSSCYKKIANHRAALFGGGSRIAETPACKKNAATLNSQSPWRELLTRPRFTTRVPVGGQVHPNRHEIALKNEADVCKHIFVLHVIAGLLMSSA